MISQRRARPMVSARTRDCSAPRRPPRSALPSGRCCYFLLRCPRSSSFSWASWRWRPCYLCRCAVNAGNVSVLLGCDHRSGLGSAGRTGRPGWPWPAARLCVYAVASLSIGAVDGLHQRSSLFHALRTLAESCRLSNICAQRGPPARHGDHPVSTPPQDVLGAEAVIQLPRGQWRCTSALLVALQFGELTSYVQSTGATGSSAVSSARATGGAGTSFAIPARATASTGYGSTRPLTSAHDRLYRLRRRGPFITVPSELPAPNRFTLR